MLEMYRKMQKLDAQWKAGKKIDCPKDLCNYLKGIVLNDHAHEEPLRAVQVILCEEAVAYITERLSSAPQNEKAYLEMALKTVIADKAWYETHPNGKMEKSGLYDLLLKEGAEKYGWNK